MSGDSNKILPSARNLSVFGAIAGTLESNLLSKMVKPLLWSTTSLTPAFIAGEARRRVHSRYTAITDSDGDLNGEKTGPQRLDMLGSFIACKNPKTGERLSFSDVVSHSTTVFGAGSDTTALALNAFFYFVLRAPAVYTKLQSVIDTAFSEGRLSEPVTYAEGTKLEYLQACMKEAMRLFPSAGMDLPRRVPKGGMMASKYFLPEGTGVGVAAFTYHRTEGAFGEDAKQFRPERWLNLNDEDRVRLERNNLVVSF